MKKITITGLIIVALAQWLVPSEIIWSRENILRNGKEFKFLTAPVDPSDPFRGKYLTLYFKENKFDCEIPKEKFNEGQAVFVLLTDSAGFAKIAGISVDEPSNKFDYVKAKTGYTDNFNDSSCSVSIEYPFEKFYINEFKAHEAEKNYRNANLRDSKQKTYALVSIYKGKAVLKDVLIDNKSIQSIILTQ